MNLLKVQNSKIVADGGKIGKYQVCSKLMDSKCEEIAIIEQIACQRYK